MIAGVYINGMLALKAALRCKNPLKISYWFRLDSKPYPIL